MQHTLANKQQKDNFWVINSQLGSIITEKILSTGLSASYAFESLGGNTVSPQGSDTNEYEPNFSLIFFFRSFEIM